MLKSNHNHSILSAAVNEDCLIGISIKSYGSMGVGSRKNIPVLIASRTNTLG